MSNFSVMPVEIISANITPMARVVYAAIMSHYRQKNAPVFPSYKRICELVGCSESTAIRCVRLLVNAGFIKKERHYLANGGCTSNRYTPSVTGDRLPSVTGDRLPSINSGRAPSITGDNSPLSTVEEQENQANNNNFFKKNNTAREGAREEMAAADAQCSAEQLDLCDCIERCDAEFKSALLFQAKNAVWVQALRINSDYYLRPINKIKVSSEDVEKYASTLSLTFGRKVRTLKHGQYLPDEVII